jgi:hypothetical protein
VFLSGDKPERAAQSCGETIADGHGFAIASRLDGGDGF